MNLNFESNDAISKNSARKNKVKSITRITKDMVDFKNPLGTKLDCKNGELTELI